MDTYPSAHGKTPRGISVSLVVAAGGGGGTRPRYSQPRKRATRAGMVASASYAAQSAWAPLPVRRARPTAARAPSAAVWPTEQSPTIPGSFAGIVSTPPCGSVARATVWATRSDHRYEE